MSKQVNHFIVTADSDRFPGFPRVIIVRTEPMPWRSGVLKAVKKLCRDVAGKNVPWEWLYIFESPWSTLEEGETEWPLWKARQTQIMFEIAADGTYKSVGKPI